MISIIFTWFVRSTGLSAFWTEAVLIAILVAGVIAGYEDWRHEVYEEGVRDTIAAIAREDKKMVDRAIDARSKWQQCETDGGNWDETTGRCH